jgi:hypothetical protein
LYEKFKNREITRKPHPGSFSFCPVVALRELKIAFI